MITRIEASKYRCLENIGIDFARYVVLVGANGAGKSTLLDIPGVIGDCLKQGDITQAFIQRQQNRPARCTLLRELVFCAQGNDFIIAMESLLPESVVKATSNGLSASKNSEKSKQKFIRYEIQLEVFNDRQLRVKNEYLFTFPKKNAPDRQGVNLHGTGCSNTDWRFIIKREQSKEAEFRQETLKGAKARSSKVGDSVLALSRILFESVEDFPSAKWFYELVTGNYLFYQPEINILQYPAPPGLPDKLMPNAANLPHLVMNLQKTDPFRFQLWEKHVKTAIPNIEHIELKEREEDHHVYFKINYHGGYEISSSGLSEGTLKILALTVLPYLDNLQAVVFVEEPENGIHPRAIEAVLQSLSSAYNSQLLISSHSPVVLANSKLSEIVCTRLADNGAVNILPGSEHPQLKDWKGQIDLGALFVTGVFE
jgi:predicted ATPase